MLWKGFFTVNAVKLVNATIFRDQAVNASARTKKYLRGFFPNNV